MTARSENPGRAGEGWVRCPNSGAVVRWRAIGKGNTRWWRGSVQARCLSCGTWCGITNAGRLVAHWVPGGPILAPPDGC